MGYKSYEEAHAAWDNYVSNGTLPPTVPAITPEIATLANQLRSDMIGLRAAQKAAMERLPPSSLLSGSSTSRRPAPIPPMSSATSPRVRKRDATLQPGSSNPPTASSTRSGGQGLLHAESPPLGFWVVFGGFAPGVFPDRCVSFILIVYHVFAIQTDHLSNFQGQCSS